MLLLRYFIVLFAFTVLSWSCAVCKVQVPDVNVSIVESHTEEAIILDIEWRFQSYFSAETRLTYDENRNQKLDKEEIDSIHKHFIEYLEAESYLTFINYIKESHTYNAAEDLTFDVEESKTTFRNERLYFHYRLKLHTRPMKDHTLYISLLDDQGFFRFFISGVSLQESALNKSIVISEYTTLFVPFGDVDHLTESHKENLLSLENNVEEVDAQDETDTYVGTLSAAMDRLKERVLELVEDIVLNESITSYLWLLFFSFLYGIIHALGPGHGKSLVAAYFLGNNRSTLKAFSIASLIGVVHTFSAFILTFTLYYLLNAYLSDYFVDLEYVMVKISALIILLIVLYLFYKRLSQRRVKIRWSENAHNVHQHSCECGACRSTSGDFGVILSAGIVPCPGTITIFVFSLSFGAYMVGFLSAVFMSMGMSLVIFTAALISIKVRKQSSQNVKLRQILDYGSLLFIFSLGLMLLLV